MLNLETHRLALAIAKKTLDENRFKIVPEDHGKNTLILQDWRLCGLQKQTAQQMGLKMEAQDIELSALSVTMDTSYILKTKPQGKYTLAM